MEHSVVYDNKKIAFSTEQPVLLLEIYRDSIIEYGLQFANQRKAGLLIRHVPNKRLNLTRVAEGGFLIYTGKESECRLFMPSPNVQFRPLTMQRFAETINFKSVTLALEHDKIVNGNTELSLDVYVSLWRNIGANIGRKLSGSTKWEKSFNIN